MESRKPSPFWSSGPGYFTTKLLLLHQRAPLHKKQYLNYLPFMGCSCQGSKSLLTTGLSCARCWSDTRDRTALFQGTQQTWEMTNNRWLLRSGKQRDVYIVHVHCIASAGRGLDFPRQDTGESRLRLPCTPACPQPWLSMCPSQHSSDGCRGLPGTPGVTAPRLRGWSRAWQGYQHSPQVCDRSYLQQGL